MFITDSIALYKIFPCLKFFTQNRKRTALETGLSRPDVRYPSPDNSHTSFTNFYSICLSPRGIRRGNCQTNRRSANQSNHATCKFSWSITLFSTCYGRMSQGVDYNLQSYLSMAPHVFALHFKFFLYHGFLV